MKLLLEDKKVEIIDYLTKKELNATFPLNEYRSVSQVLTDPKEQAIFREQMKDKESAVYKAVTAGTATHRALETGEAKDLLTEAVLDHFNTVILPDIDEVWGQEQWVLHTLHQYKGKFDAVMVYQGKLTLVDFKKTNRRRTPSTMKKYYSQLAAYKQAHEFLYPKYKIEQVAVFNIFGKVPEEVNSNITIVDPVTLQVHLNEFNDKAAQRIATAA